MSIFLVAQMALSIMLLLAMVAVDRMKGRSHVEKGTVKTNDNSQAKPNMETQKSPQRRKGKNTIH